MAAMNKKPVLLITGATSGIGKATAVRLSQKGYTVYGTGRNPSSSDADGYTLLKMDVTDEKSVRAAVQEILSREGRIDAVLCNAGFGIAGSVEETRIEDAHAQLETVFFGTLRTIQAVLPGMRASGGGTILVISSIAGRASVPFQAFYSASKFALEGLVEALRMEVRTWKVRCALIEPGDCRTGFTDARKKDIDKDSPYALAMVRALGVMEKDERSGSAPDEVAKLVESLLGKKNLRVRYTVGPGFERFAAGLKRFIPSRTYEWIFSKYYKV
jgi:NAD(P)-dependent dehydrogenase (short-subunit alcohol dehydrogenase family)